MRLFLFLSRKFKEYKKKRKLKLLKLEQEEKLRLLKLEKQERLEKERGEARRKKKERREWERAKRIKEKQNHQLILDIEKNRDKIIAEKEFNTPVINRKNNGGVLCLRGEKFLLCEEGLRMFERDFQNDDYYTIIIKDDYLAREHDERGFIQFFHRWLMQEAVREFAEEQEIERNDIEVHHVDLTTTNDKIKNLNPMHKDDHKKLHIRLKFNGSDEDFEEWYEENIK